MALSRALRIGSFAKKLRVNQNVKKIFAEDPLAP
jgi:hypothetical protein